MKIEIIAFALGARADAEDIRAGQEEASVTLVVEAPKTKEFAALLSELAIGATLEDGLIFLRRSLNAAGRSRAFLNDEPVTLKALQTVAQSLVNLVAQHASQKLFKESYLLESLDRFGGHETKLVEYQKAFRDFRTKQKDFLELQARVEATRQQEDFLRFQWQELSKARLQEGEEEELEGRKKRLKHAVNLASQSFERHEALSEAEDSISDRLGRVLATAEKSSNLDPSLGSLVEALRDSTLALDRASDQLRDYRRGLQEDPEELENLENRLALIHELKRKYRLELPALVLKSEELQGQIDELENFSDKLGQLDSELQNSRKNLENQAKALSQVRGETAKRLAKQLEKILKELALPHARIKIQIQALTQAEEYRENGSNQLSLEVSFNPGEEARPIGEVISGGELSRLLLAFCETLFSKEELGTLIFDEVDTGIGGGVAELLGKRLKGLSQKSQVLCVTHLPQIACHSDWHYRVEKEVKAGRTFSKILLLGKEERVGELARMLAGVKVTEQALKHARELLKNAAA